MGLYVYESIVFNHCWPIVNKFRSPNWTSIFMQICLPKILSNHGFTPSQCPYHQLIFNYLRVNIRKINRVIFLIEKILEEKSCKPFNNMPSRAQSSTAQHCRAQPSRVFSSWTHHASHISSAEPNRTQPSRAQPSLQPSKAQPSPARLS